MRGIHAHPPECVVSAFDELFGQMAGQQIPGGCDMCDSYQTVEPVSEGVHSLTIHHDDDCPILRASRRGSN
jgi:hypothetical protein